MFLHKGEKPLKLKIKEFLAKWAVKVTWAAPKQRSVHTLEDHVRPAGGCVLRASLLTLSLDVSQSAGVHEDRTEI